MNQKRKRTRRHRASLDVPPGFETKLKLLAAKWGVKTNAAAMRAVDQALARNWPDDEKAILKRLDTRVEELVHHLLP